MIKIKNLNLSYPILDNSHRSLKKKVFNITTGGLLGYDSNNLLSVNALNDINLQITEGERVGIIGDNGSGKSTLLRVLSRIYTDYSGYCDINGNISSLIDISSFLDVDATAYENIRIKMLLDDLDLKKEKDLITFVKKITGLGDYLNLQLKTYSSGMMMRFAFSLAIYGDQDIIIMDEWLSVGDFKFQNKAKKLLTSKIKKSKIFIIATHDLDLINNICTRILTLKNGSIIKDKKI